MASASVAIELDKVRHLKFDWPTFRMLENAMGGQPVNEIVSNLRGLSLTALAAVLWAAFQHEDPTLTEDAAGELVFDFMRSGKRFSVLGDAVGEALKVSGIYQEPADTDEALVTDRVVMLDRARRIKFGLRSIKFLEASMGGLGIATIYLHCNRLGANALTAALFVGMKTEDHTITMNLTAKMIQRYIEDGGSVRTLADTVQKAIEDTGVFRGTEMRLDDPDEDAEGNAAAVQMEQV